MFLGDNEIAEASDGGGPRFAESRFGFDRIRQEYEKIEASGAAPFPSPGSCPILLRETLNRFPPMFPRISSLLSESFGRTWRRWARVRQTALRSTGCA